MSAHRLIVDRPFLRLFEPDSDIATTEWTIQRAFDSFRWPELLGKSKGHRLDARRWVRLWYEFETDLGDSLAIRGANSGGNSREDPRIIYPLRVDQVSSKHLAAFSMWLVERDMSNSSANKAVGEIRAIIDRAASEGVPVQTIKTKRQATSSRPRYYYDDTAVGRLWKGCDSLTWPPRYARAKRTHSFAGTGLPPPVFWRAVLVLLRNYGMRVQDLIAYAENKSPLTWEQISDDPRSPNHDSLESWPLGWLAYTASKTQQKFYLPLTASARGAIDRLRAGAYALHGGTIPPTALVLPCPRSHGLTERFKKLQTATGVATRDGKPYELEDFRKTVATYSAQSDRGLPYALCGWGNGGIKERHYQHQEPLLVRKLHLAPLPACFGEWIDPRHTAAVTTWVATQYGPAAI